jgi:hypothetical protein
MIFLANRVRVLVAMQPVDYRKDRDGLSQRCFPKMFVAR